MALNTKCASRVETVISAARAWSMDKVSAMGETIWHAIKRIQKNSKETWNKNKRDQVNVRK